MICIHVSEINSYKQKSSFGTKQKFKKCAYWYF